MNSCESTGNENVLSSLCIPICYLDICFHFENIKLILPDQMPLQLNTEIVYDLI